MFGWFKKKPEPALASRPPDPRTNPLLGLDHNAMRLAAAREAVGRLGLLEPSAEAIIYHLLDGRFVDHPKKICTAYRQDGEQLTKDEKKAAGLRSNAAMSRKAFGELTALGREEPLRAHETTLLRATFSLGRYQTVLRARETTVPQFHDDYKYSVLRMDCPVCAAMDGDVVKGDEVSIFAPDGCTCDTANYSVGVYVDWLADLD